jgi:hypothetical protein
MQSLLNRSNPSTTSPAKEKEGEVSMIVMNDPKKKAFTDYSHTTTFLNLVRNEEPRVRPAKLGPNTEGTSLEENFFVFRA